MSDNSLEPKKGGVDLDGEWTFGQPCGFHPGAHHEPWPAVVRPADELFAVDHLCPDRGPPLRQVADVRRAIPGDGVAWLLDDCFSLSSKQMRMKRATSLRNKKQIGMRF